MARGLFVSVVIASGREAIDPCLASILSQKYGEMEVIVVSHRDMSFTKKNSKIRFFRSPENNVSMKRNIGVKNSKGKIICFLDDDIELPPGFFENAFKKFGQHPRMAGFGGPNIIPKDAGFREQITDKVLNSKLFGSGVVTYGEGEIDRVAKTGELHSCNLFITREAFDTIGGFNEGIIVYGGDTEFCYLAQQRHGLELRFISPVFVYHHRRDFGIEYVKQRFRSKTNTGRLMWTYPKMYFTNKSAVIFHGGVFFLVASVLFFPFLIPAMAALYFTLLILTNLNLLRTSKSMFIAVPFALVISNVVYVVSIYFGLLSIVWDYKKIMAIRR